MIQRKCVYFMMWKIEWCCAYGTYGAKAAETPLHELIWPPHLRGLLAVCSNQLLCSKSPAAGLN